MLRTRGGPDSRGHGGAAALAACPGPVLHVHWHARTTATTHTCMWQACLPACPACGRAQALRGTSAGLGWRARGAHREGELFVQVVLRPDQHLEQARQPRLLLLRAALPRWAVRLLRALPYTAPTRARRWVDRRKRDAPLEPYPTLHPSHPLPGAAASAPALRRCPLDAGRRRPRGGARPRRAPRRQTPAPVPAAARRRKWRHRGRPAGAPAEAEAPHLALAVQDGRVELARGLLPLRNVHQVRDRAAARVLECQQRHRPLCAPHKAPEALLLNLLQVRGKVLLEI